jgi:hypothetical protein
MSWKSYINDRIIKECDGYYVIKPSSEMNDTVPFSCPLCDYLMRTQEDEKSYKRFSCCESCEMYWARPNQEKWKEGWRPPSKEVIEKAGRKKINVSIEI